MRQNEHEGTRLGRRKCKKDLDDFGLQLKPMARVVASMVVARAERLSRARESVAWLDDEELITATQRLLREERMLSARLLVHLAAIDTRQLYRQHA